MENPRFVETGRSSFFGEYLYDLVVPQNHFLRQLNKIIDWERFTRRLLKLYKGGGLVEDSVVTWILPVLKPGETIRLTFQVTVLGGNEIINDRYAVRCDEGVFAYGEPVVTYVKSLMYRIILPITVKN